MVGVRDLFSPLTRTRSPHCARFTLLGVIPVICGPIEPPRAREGKRGEPDT